MFVWSYNSARSCASISQSRGNCELASTPDAHANDTLIPTGNDLAAAKLEAECLSSIPRSVEFVPSVPRHAHIVNFCSVTGRCLVAVSSD